MVEVTVARSGADADRGSQAVDGVARLRDLELLREIDQATVFTTGLEFFHALLRSLAQSLGTRYAFVARFESGDYSTMHIIAFWDGETRTFKDDYPFPVEGTPCVHVLDGSIVALERGVCDAFPAERRRGVQSYLAIPLLDASGGVVGHLVAADTAEHDWAQLDRRIISLFAMRTAAEIVRHQYEQALESARAAAVAANRARGEFLAHMSHELRTPLTGILGHAELLAHDAVGAQAEHVRAIRRCGEHLLSLVNEVLDLARVDAGHVDLRSEAFALADVIAVVRDAIQVRADAARLEFVVYSPADPPPRLLGDARRLQQILINLLGNAVKFTARGRVTLAIDARVCAAQRVALEFAIADTGPGLSEAEQARLFDPFVRIPTTAQATEGSGLGLAITQRLVRMLGGSLTVASEPGVGSTFTVVLEFAAVRPALEPEAIADVDLDQASDARALPKALLDSLHTAARAGDIERIRAELARCSEQGHGALADRLGRVAATYDMPALQARLAEIEPL